ncbi:small-subunit processome [Kockovaella imperatae]|uniref:Small-subunit processome n=1 Tax=Kockovaella imperatae TaxID=4999 RepID=A0A1Y1UDX2_9TREE|nr:small-subunit processome [Kockovaella imperatae]ORX35706.1 small-subunit processome [Kockovaella imperatae]
MVKPTLKSTFARRNHKERAQPLHRQRLGLLEKHKDYVHRARDYKSKQDRIKKLREKAAFKNKDEFYWGMVKGKTKDGVAIADRGNEALSVDVVKLLKTQDAGYIRLQIAKDEKTIGKLRRELEVTAPGASSSEWDAAAELAEVEKLAEMGVVLQPRESQSSKRKGKGRAPPTGHVLFADGRDEFEAESSTALRPMVTSTDTGSEQEPLDLGWVNDTPKQKTKPQKEPTVDPEPNAEEEARAHRMSLLTSLSAHLNRIKQLRQAEQKLQATKSLMGKGAARKVRNAGWVEDDSQHEDRNGERKRWEGKVWKWKLERKR